MAGSRSTKPTRARFTTPSAVGEKAFGSRSKRSTRGSSPFRYCEARNAPAVARIRTANRTRTGVLAIGRNRKRRQCRLREREAHRSVGGRDPVRPRAGRRAGPSRGRRGADHVAISVRPGAAGPRLRADRAVLSTGHAVGLGGPAAAARGQSAGAPRRHAAPPRAARRRRRGPLPVAAPGRPLPGAAQAAARDDRPQRPAKERRGGRGPRDGCGRGPHPPRGAGARAAGGRGPRAHPGDPPRRVRAHALHPRRAASPARAGRGRGPRGALLRHRPPLQGDRRAAARLRPARGRGAVGRGPPAGHTDGASA